MVGTTVVNLIVTLPHFMVWGPTLRKDTFAKTRRNYEVTSRTGSTSWSRHAARLSRSPPELRAAECLQMSEEKLEELVYTERQMNEQREGCKTKSVWIEGLR